MEKKYLSLREIQKEELEILKKVIQFFEKNGIQYYIAYGTLLGAVRHKGFIPWDDDIDLVIARPEYNRLVEILKKDNRIAENIEEIGWEISNSDSPYLKIVNKNIAVEAKLAYDTNLWIDIFPLDGLPEKEEDIKQYLKKIEFYRSLFCWKRSQVRKLKIYSSNKLKKFLKMLITKCFKIVYYNKLIEKYIQYCSKYDFEQSEYLDNTIWNWDSSPNKKINKQLLLQNALYDFEGLKVNGVRDYDTVLKKDYGNYMELPPEEKRETHEFKAWKVKEEY